ncbi:MFS transporter [Alicyclobacillus vulcanalis]|uniref:Predicted arabinose efflux permease, MFS family n=2 Tax=Alicyclobacillus TaxID=29330 RepID=A0A1N7N8Y9_9BACL|nr:MFS transporter [Alicyclobacillus vulcanalis]SIS94824.1 Predicted arabinose efflux permease, MFS family [Alicyclobacillus vulcanalis]
MLSAALRRMMVDTTPLRTSSDFLRLWIGSGISTFGGTMTSFAVMLQVYTLTHKSLDVGLASLASVLPGVLFVLLGGSVGDRVDRRKLVLLATSGQMVVSALLAVQAFAAWRTLGAIYALLCVQSLLVVISAPARRTFVPRVLPKDQVRAGQTLNTLVIRFAEVAGPALGGVLAGWSGLGWCYALDALSFLAALYAVYRLPPMQPGAIERNQGMLGSVAEGLRFLVTSRALLGAMLADLSVTVLGVPNALLPALVSARFGGQPEALGLLMGATGVGGLLVLFLSGPVRHIRYEGRAIVVACIAWGAAVCAFGLSPFLWLSLMFLAFMGALDSILVVMRSTLIQQRTPDELRGRISSVDYLVGSGGPQLGNLRAGIVGSVLPVSAAIVIGGASTIVAMACVARFIPELRRARADEDV